jgi:Holliday junction resolvase RusA-like endonuclease
LKIWDKAKNFLAWKDSIGLQVRTQKPEFYEGAVSISCQFYLSRPASAKRKQHTVKPDYINLLKTAEDALKGICYKDDCQLVSGFASKEYTLNEPGIIITVNTLDIP